MAFRGLFIGIDRYRSQSIDWLSCSARDAKALDAMFADNLGGETVLVVDEEATRERIESEFLTLRQTSIDDVVVIAYSGHGTETHQLVAYDTDVTDLTGSTISLQSIADKFSEIPARRLVLLLDCCFAGGIGAKVLQVSEVSRDMLSAEARLERISGQGRLIITASGANEPAWENRQLRHGVFTHYLLEALQGAPGSATDGRVSVYQLIEYVVQRVVDHTANSDEPQNPTMRGAIDGEFSWPIFQAGDRYRAAFPELAGAIATSDVSSLSHFGFPAEMVEAWASAIPSLNELQTSAINEYGVLRGENLLVSAPTSSGKTMIGELASLNSILCRGRAAFLFPLKALVADKLAHFTGVYGRLGVRTIEATGETDDLLPLLKGQYDVALLTYEKFTSICVTFPHVLRQLDVIVVDETQMIADESRGANLEFMLTLFRARQSGRATPQLIALSAVIGETHGFERWLGGRLLRKTERPVPLDEGILYRDGTFRYIQGESGQETAQQHFVLPAFGKGSSQDLITPLVRKLVEAGEQVIVFREQKGETRGCAKYLAAALQLPPASAALSELPSTDASLASGDLKLTLEGGVAFHNADLQREERAIVEQHFRAADATIRVIVATTTLAMGINTPASSVVVVGLTHPMDKPYTVAEYKNLCGRAGRLGFSEHGKSLLIATNPGTETVYWNNYVLGTPEDLRSRFFDSSTDPRTLICRLMTATQRWTQAGFTAEQLATFLESSFGAYIARTREDSWKVSHSELLESIGSLERHGLIERNEAANLQLTDVGKVVGETGIQVASTISIVECLGQVHADQVTDPTLLTVVQLAQELDESYIPINSSSTLKEPQHWYLQLRQQHVPASVLTRLRESAGDTKRATQRAKRAIACLLYISDMPMEAIEKTLRQFGGGFDGMAGPVRSVASRTCDFLTATGRLATILHPAIDLDRRLERLSTRLTFGVTGAIADLAGYIGAALTRGDYAQLESFGFVTGSAVQLASDSELAKCVSGSLEKVRAIRSGAEAILGEAEDAHAQAIEIPQYKE
ncbi:caspase family protein [Paraburkholderia madseniana]|uniref:DEAD/DEAH box helicase n=1 Tax=Paraburkholderia madseniana TaxID=2599607 RepID=UPI0038BB553E